MRERAHFYWILSAGLLGGAVVFQCLRGLSSHDVREWAHFYWILSAGLLGGAVVFQCLRGLSSHDVRQRAHFYRDLPDLLGGANLPKRLRGL